MVSITASSKNWLERLRCWLLLLVFVPALAWTAEIDVLDQKLTATEEGYVLSADFKFELTSRLEEAVNRGVALNFVTEFELTRERWYWFDSKLITASQNHRLSYHALTRQYRLSTGGLHQSFETLGDALRVLSRLRQWPVIDKNTAAGDGYQAALRIYLDVSQLPRPFQISALGNKDWTLVSEWKRWTTALVPLSTEAK